MLAGDKPRISSLLFFEHLILRKKGEMQKNYTKILISFTLNIIYCPL